ncbi:MAG TPA: hypothetical protein VMR98_05010 [Candidatus Polarisedimenticolaceae bacterium]|nr:hypothetical protein [Candidatus Polarisedimenticolaceae bacterium]
MNDGAWERIVDTIDATIGIDRHGKEQQPLPDQPNLNQSVEFFEFSKDGEEYRLERSSGPAVVDRKTHYSHREGTANRIEYIYDEKETAHKVTLYRRKNSDDEWEAVDLSQLAL